MSRVTAIVCGWMLCAAVVAGAEGPPPSSDAARAAYASAAALQNREAWDLAAEEWQSLVAAHPQDPLALKGRYYLAICQIKNGRWPDAERTLREVVASKADADTIALARWELARGLFLAAQAKPTPEAFGAAAASLNEFLVATPRHPQAADAAYFLGESLWQQGKRDEAVAAWRRFLDTHADSPRLPEVLYALGVGEAQTGQAAAAAATLARFAKQFPTHRLAPDVALWRADIATGAGKPAEAEEMLVPLAAAAGPRTAEALDRLGTARWSQKKWAAAADAFSRLAAEHPSSPLAARAQVTAGRALMEAGRTDDARTLFEKLAAGDGPEAFDAAHQLVALEIKAKRPDRGVEVARQALEKLAARKDADRTTVAKLELDRADALWEVPARRPQAAAAYTAVAADHPDTPAAMTAMSMAALALLELQKPAESLAQADAFLGRHAAKADPKTVLDVRTIRAEALLALGKSSAAAEAFHELAAANPGSDRRPAWEIREAAALAAGGQWRKAHELLSKSAPRLGGEQKAEALLLDATALVELGEPGAAAKLLATIDREQPKWSRRAEATLLAVRALREAGDKAAALALAERLVAEQPEGKNADVAWYRLGQLRQDAGKFADAIAAYAKCVAIAPRGSRAAAARLATGWCHEAEGRLPDAIAAWTALIDTQPDSPAAASALLARCDARQRGGDFSGGLADVQRLLSDARAGRFTLDAATTGEARLLEGLCLAGAKRHAEAAAAFRGLLKEQPQFAAADRVLFELGVVQALDGKGPDAAATFAELAQRYPRSRYAADAWLEVGEGRWAAKRWEEAAEAYRAAIAAAAQAGDAGKPLAEQARHKLGWTHSMRGDHAAAAQAFKEQLAADPAGPLAADGQAMLGESLLAQGKPADAERAFAAALADPAKLSGAGIRGAAFVRACEAAAAQEKWEQSLAIAERFQAVDPQSPQAAEGHYAAAWARQNLGRLAEALDGYRAVADGPRTELAARARLMEGEVLFEQGNHKDAIKAFFKVAYGFGERQAPPAFHPWQAQATFEAARCFEVLEKPDQARTLYAELVERYPDSEHVPAARKRLEALGPAPASAGGKTS